MTGRAAHATALLGSAPGVGPDFGAVTGTTLADAVGALLMIVLIAAVATAIVAGVSWAWGEATGNWQAATRGRTALLVAVGAAVLAGAGVGLANWLIDLGTGL
jgi:hypothetical protein